MSLQQAIFEGFLAKLLDSSHIDESRVRQLRKLLSEEDRLRVEDLVTIFSSDSEVLDKK